jgi:hypothetical protein
VKRLALLLAAVALAGCGGSKTATTRATTTVAKIPDPAAAMRRLIAAEPSLAGKVATLYIGGPWAVVSSTSPGKAHAVVFHLAGNRWVPDRSGGVKISILGPQPGTTAPALAQVAIGFKSKQPFVESGLWIDGTDIEAKGGGSPTSGSIYGAEPKALKPGEHVAVGYARTNGSGAAVAWIFRTG